jgi:transcriptional regulator with XRE-family HTH domain
VLRRVFGMNLKYQRLRQGLTQEEAAARCKISSEYWGKMERGVQAATLDVVEKVSVGLNVDAKELLNEVT